MVEIPEDAAMKSFFRIRIRNVRLHPGTACFRAADGANGYTAVLRSSIDRAILRRESTASQHSRSEIRVCFQ
jgi:hypothetical protein